MTTSTDVEKYFNEIAASYEKRPPKEIEALHGRAAQIVVSELGLSEATPMSPKESKILEFGSGTGLITMVTAPLARTVFAVDVSTEMTKELEKKIEQRGLKVRISKFEFPETD